MEHDPLAQRILDALGNAGKMKPKRAGNDNYLIRCPFHEDNDPSFCMSSVNGLFICYGCGVEGNFRKFLTMLGMTAQEIHLHYGVTLKTLASNAPPPKDLARPNVVMDINRHIDEDLLGLFYYCPEDLLAEGFTEETLREFGVGVDKWHNRITFPLRDLEGHLVGISGRAMSLSQEPRYKVYLEEYKTWELPAYNTDKSNLLWNVHTMFSEVSRLYPSPVVAIVEGFKAAMWLKQAGIKYVVALMTKKMSPAQKWILNRMGGDYRLMLDNDEAGIGGTINASRELQKSSLVKIVEYDGHQPTDVPLEDIPRLIAEASSYNNMVL